MSNSTTVSWEHAGADYEVTVSISRGHPGDRYGAPFKYGPPEPPELEVQSISGDGPITDDMYVIAGEDDKVYERALQQLSDAHEDDRY